MSNKKYINPLIFCVAVIILSGIAYGFSIYFSKPEGPRTLDYVPQFVLFSFDGSKKVDIWKETRQFEYQMEAEKIPLNFTYFINAAYFLTDDKKDLYQAPGQPRGKSNIGFSEDTANLRDRIIEVNSAIADGDEISSHSVGHFNGSAWTKEDWMQEFASFDAILFGTDKNYPELHLPLLNLKPLDIVGFRAPDLGNDPSLYEALRDAHVLYDSSEIGKSTSWPTKDSYGIWHIPLGMVRLDGGTYPVLAMDYNIWTHQTNRENGLKKGTLEWERNYQDTIASFRAYFNRNYTSSRAPVLIGYHFEDWNDGLYFQVLKDFAHEVCGKPQVRCSTFKELTQYLNTYGVPTVATSTTTPLVKK